MARGLTYLLREMSTRNPPGEDNAQPARKVDNLIAISKPIA
jgi:hypothetical protein